MGVVSALVRSSFLVNAVYAKAGREYGLTPRQGRLLCVLMPQPYGMSELGAMPNLAKPSLTGLVDRTSQPGLVRREQDPVDGRAVRVALTEEGARPADARCTETYRRIAPLPSRLARADCDRLAELLERVVLDNKVPTVFIEPGDVASSA